MAPRGNSIVNLLALLMTWSLAVSAQEVIDDDGNTVTLDRPAQRIISLAPSLTELTFSAGAGDRLIGVIEYSDYPPAALELPRIGRHDMLDLERILTLKPDLILAWRSGNPRASVEKLRQLGLTVYMAEPRDLQSISSNLERIGSLAGTGTIARARSTQFRAELAKLRSRYHDAATVRTFYQVWNDPLITAGGNELTNDIISLCGGANIFADVRQIAPKVSTEAILSRRPEVIIGSGLAAERPAWLDDWRRWQTLPAVERNNLFSIPPAELQRQTLRVLTGSRQICEFLEIARKRRQP